MNRQNQCTHGYIDRAHSYACLFAGHVSRQTKLSKTLIERVRAAIRTFIAERGSVTFFRESKFFFTLYHAGKVNIILHVVSLSFLFYGLSAKSVPLVLIGLFVFDEMGHAYNYLIVHNRETVSRLPSK
jgi:hypothetical protein